SMKLGLAKACFLNLLGDATVGKSALAQLFETDGAHFQKNYTMVSLEKGHMWSRVGEKSLENHHPVVGKGQETLGEWIQPSVLCLVYDVTKEQSFINCALWLERVRAKAQGMQIPGILVGNKTDLIGRRVVERTRAQEWATSQGLEYCETSVKKMENFETPFHRLARLFRQRYLEVEEIFHSLV
uniref:Intraflagellar transport 27 n=1 Tax=Ornithorhynchus anatinus TaxID=9258 RepID=A0A6I8N076_ORNAN